MVNAFVGTVRTVWGRMPSDIKIGVILIIALVIAGPLWVPFAKVIILWARKNLAIAGSWLAIALAFVLIARRLPTVRWAPTRRPAPRSPINGPNAATHGDRGRDHNGAAGATGEGPAMDARNQPPRNLYETVHGGVPLGSSRLRPPPA